MLHPPVESATGSGDSGKQPYWNLTEGDTIAEDEFSDYSSLGKLVNRYNADVRAKDAKLCVSARAVELRDLLAHGRVAAMTPDTSTLKIIKFSRPQGRRVTVTSSVLMDDKWFDDNKAFCLGEIEKITEAIDSYAA